MDEWAPLFAKMNFCPRSVQHIIGIVKPPIKICGSEQELQHETVVLCPYHIKSIQIIG